jgi:hypothetical protein
MRTVLTMVSLLAFVTLLIAIPSGSAQVDRVAALERKVGDLEIDGKLYKSDIEQLKLDREVDADSIQGIADSVDDLRHDLDDGGAKIGKLRSDLDELSKRVSDLEGKLRK